MLKKLNEILSLFSTERSELSSLEIAELLGRPKSTVYRLLSQIQEAGFLDQDRATGRYRLGIRLATLGYLAQRSTSLQRITFPVLQELSRATGETATLMVLEGSDGITIDVVESFQPLMVPALLGGHLPLHATAGGKVLLAWKSREQRLSILPRPLPEFTPTTITDVEELMAELDTVRERGFSTVNGEWVTDIVSAAAPIRNYTGAVVGALTTGGPRSRVSREVLLFLVENVVQAASRASGALGYLGGGFRSDGAAINPLLQARVGRSEGTGSTGLASGGRAE